MLERARPSAASSRSRPTTSQPPSSSTCTMPAPIVPRPTTPTRVIASMCVNGRAAARPRPWQRRAGRRLRGMPDPDEPAAEDNCRCRPALRRRCSSRRCGRRSCARSCSGWKASASERCRRSAGWSSTWPARAPSPPPSWPTALRGALAAGPDRRDHDGTGRQALPPRPRRACDRARGAAGRGRARGRGRRLDRATSRRHGDGDPSRRPPWSRRPLSRPRPSRLSQCRS